MALLVLSGGQAAGEADGAAVALLRQTIHVRTSGVGQSQEPADLVEGLACGVVEGTAELNDVGGDITDAQEVGVATGDDEPDEPLRQGAVDQLIDRQVPDDVVDAVDRCAQARSQGLGGGDADGQGTDESGAGAHGDGVDLAQVDVGLLQRGIKGGQEGLQVSPRGDLGDNPAEARVLVHGGGGDVGEELAAVHEGHAGLVASGLDAEDEGGAHKSPPYRLPRRTRDSRLPSRPLPAGRPVMVSTTVGTGRPGDDTEQAPLTGHQQGGTRD